MLANARTHAHERSPVAQLLGSEDFLLLGSTILHMATPHHALKLVSGAFFAWLNLVAYMLNEVVPPNSFTTSLLPLLKYAEPVLLSWACYADYGVVAVYFYQVLSCQTLLVHALIFAYLIMRRMEHSALSRATLHNIADICYVLSQKDPVPLCVGAAGTFAKRLVETMVPIEQPITAVPNDSESVATRATSIVFEGVAIIDDLG